MTNVGILISIILISIAAALMSGVVVWFKLKNEFDKRVGKLEARLPLLEERQLYLEEEFIKHMRKHH
jgi:hypothetical protein